MRIPDLGYLLPHTLSPGSSLFRIQWRRARQLTITRGPLKLAPLKQGSGRFDLSGEPVAYFAETPETSAYETLARRETVALSLRSLEQRALLSMATMRPLQLADLRPHATAFPVLQSLRFTETRALAEDLRLAGYEGIVYASAQHPKMDCFVLFESALGALKTVRRATPLLNTEGQLHSCVAAVIRGSRVLVGA